MAVEIVQFEIPGRGRRVGFVEGEIVRDITAHRPELVYLYYGFQAAVRMNRPLSEYLRSLVPANSTAMLSWRALLDGTPGGTEPFLHPPLDHPDPHRVLVTGTGLTHTGSMQSRDQMHAPQKEAPSSSSSRAQDAASVPKTDSARIYLENLCCLCNSIWRLHIDHKQTCNPQSQYMISAHRHNI